MDIANEAAQRDVGQQIFISKVTACLAFNFYGQSGINMEINAGIDEPSQENNRLINLEQSV